MKTAWLPALMALVILGACTTPIFRPVDMPEQLAAPPSQSSPLTPIAMGLAERAGAESSGFLLLNDNRSALEWRLRLIDAATDSIDLQYYLWYGDKVGRLIAHRVIAAADRGVRVRLLVDDLNTLLADAATLANRDTVAAWLDSHPNIQLRLFNPWAKRDLASRVGESMANVRRVNHRMHNKSLIVDNRAVILGGRNLGDEYMGLNTSFNFRDLDVLGIGPVATQASQVFDSFWNSNWVLPAGALGISITQEESFAAREQLARSLRDSEELTQFPVDWVEPRKSLEALEGQLIVGSSRLISDEPCGADLCQSMLGEIRGLARSAKADLRIANAYIIPTRETIRMLEQLHSKGVRLQVLTNSLASHDVPAVNSHYRRWRKPLLNAGVDLHELRHDGATQMTLADTPPVRGKFMGLHSKAMIVDGQRVYIGSMNYDPRSAALNTEMGAVIDSPELAKALGEIFDRDMLLDNSWRVTLSDKGRPIWTNSSGTVFRQPARHWWQRVEDVFFRLFPKELY